MCIIIHKPSDKRISNRTLRRAYFANPHGWGIVAKDKNGNLTIARGTSKVGDLVSEYKKVEDQEVLIHCRIATSGEKDIVNTHPFEVMPGVWMMHNGTLTEKMVQITDKSKCDSWHFANYVLAPTFKKNPLLLQYPERMNVIQDLESVIGSWSTNKIVIMSQYGPTIIAGKGKGKEVDGVWYSNASAFRGSDEHKKRLARFKSGTDSKAYPSGGYGYYGTRDDDWGGYYYHAGKSTARSVSAQRSVSSSATGSGTGKVVPLDSKRDVPPTGGVGSKDEAGNFRPHQGSNGDSPGPGTATTSVRGDTPHTQVPTGDRTTGNDDFEASHLQLSEEFLKADQMEDQEIAEELRWDASFRYAEILFNFSLDELKTVVEKYPDGIAEVLFYLLRGELDADVLDDKLFASAEADDEASEESSPVIGEVVTADPRKPNPEQYEEFLCKELANHPVFQALWELCFTHGMEEQLIEREMIEARRP